MALTQDQLKELVGKELSLRVKSGDVLCVGTGSTVTKAIQAIGQRVKEEGIIVKAISTSVQTAWLCEELGIDVLSTTYSGKIAFGFDGADAVDSRLRLIKGRGGAMLIEKIIASRCRQFVIVIDESKLCDNLASKCPVPIEIIPEALQIVQTALKKFPVKSVELRLGKAKYGPVITEKGNLILDVTFSDINDAMEKDLKAITGVVETGLFLTQATEVIVATEQGLKVLKPNS